MRKSKISLCAIVLTLVFYALLFYPVFLLRQNIIHNEVKEILKSSGEKTFCNLKLSSAEFKDLKWLREGKEFFYHDELYDVKNIEVFADGTRSINAFCDSDEKDLNEEYNDSFERGPISKKSVRILFKLLSQVVPPGSEVGFENNNQNSFCVIKNSKHYSSHINELFTPPPERLIDQSNI